MTARLTADERDALRKRAEHVNIDRQDDTP